MKAKEQATNDRKQQNATPEIISIYLDGIDILHFSPILRNFIAYTYTISTNLVQYLIDRNWIISSHVLLFGEDLLNNERSCIFSIKVVRSGVATGLLEEVVGPLKAQKSPHTENVV